MNEHPFFFFKGSYIPHVFTFELLVSNTSDPEGCTTYMRSRTTFIDFMLSHINLCLYTQHKKYLETLESILK